MCVSKKELICVYAKIEHLSGVSCVQHYAKMRTQVVVVILLLQQSFAFEQGVRVQFITVSQGKGADFPNGCIVHRGGGGGGSGL